jgi:hypothetical protein
MIHTAEQNRLFHALLKTAGYDADMKEGLVLEVSGGKYDSSKHLSVIEMAKAIKQLNAGADNIFKEKQRNCLTVARDLNLITGIGENTNYDKLNKWIENKFGVKQFNYCKVDKLDEVYRGLKGWQRNVNSKKQEQDGTLENIEASLKEILTH